MGLLLAPGGATVAAPALDMAGDSNGGAEGALT